MYYSDHTKSGFRQQNDWTWTLCWTLSKKQREYEYTRVHKYRHFGFWERMTTNGEIWKCQTDTNRACSPRRMKNNRPTRIRHYPVCQQNSYSDTYIYPISNVVRSLLGNQASCVLPLLLTYKRKRVLCMTVKSPKTACISHQEVNRKNRS